MCGTLGFTPGPCLHRQPLDVAGHDVTDLEATGACFALNYAPRRCARSLAGAEVVLGVVVHESGVRLDDVSLRDYVQEDRRPASAVTLPAGAFFTFAVTCRGGSSDARGWPAASPSRRRSMLGASHHHLQSYGCPSCRDRGGSCCGASLRSGARSLLLLWDDRRSSDFRRSTRRGRTPCRWADRAVCLWWRRRGV